MTLSSSYFRKQFVWMGVFFLQSIIFLTFSSSDFLDTICVDGSLLVNGNMDKNSSTSSFRNCFDMFFVSWNYWLSIERIIWDPIFFLVFKGALKEAIKEYQKKYGVFRFPTFLESIIFWLFLQFICHWMRIQVLPSPKSVNEVVFCEFARSPEFLSIFPLTKRIKKTQFVWMEFSSDFGVTLFILVLFRLLLLISIVIFAN